MLCGAGSQTSCRARLVAMAAAGMILLKGGFLMAKKSQELENELKKIITSYEGR